MRCRVSETGASKLDVTSSVPAKEQSVHSGGRPSPKSLAAVDVVKSSVVSKSKTEPTAASMTSVARNGPPCNAEFTRLYLLDPLNLSTVILRAVRHIFFSSSL